MVSEDISKQKRLEWFNEVHPSTTEKQVFTQPPEMFNREYTNLHEEVKISIKDGALIYTQFGHETKLVHISETDFLPIF